MNPPLSHDVAIVRTMATPRTTRDLPDVPPSAGLRLPRPLPGPTGAAARRLEILPQPGLVEPAGFGEPPDGSGAFLPLPEGRPFGFDPAPGNPGTPARGHEALARPGAVATSSLLKAGPVGAGFEQRGTGAALHPPGRKPG